MLQRSGPHLLLLIALCSVSYSQTMSLPYTSSRPTRHGDGLYTSDYAKVLGQLAAIKYLESLYGKRNSSDEQVEPVPVPVPVKRHTEAIFTSAYSLYRKKMVAKNSLNALLTEKEGNKPVKPKSTRTIRSKGTKDEPSTFQETHDDINNNHLLNNFQMQI